MLIQDKLKNQKLMTEIEVSIANEFLNQGKKLEDKSARKISNELFIAPSTIVRFCKKIGYSGYDEFRKKYVTEIDYLDTHFQKFDPNFPFKQTDSDWHISNNISHLYKETVSDTLGLIQFKKLEAAHAVLNNSDMIYIFSAGDLLEPAYSFKNKMIRLGKNVEVFERTDLAYVAAAQKTNNASFILISYSGETKHTLRLAEYLHQEDIPFIALTSIGDSTLSKLADITLYLSSREKLVTNLGNFSSVLSTMYLLDVLYSCVLGSDYQKNYQKKTEIAREYEIYRRSSNPMIND